MAIQPNGTAPYAPPKTVIELIGRYRERGLSKPFTPEVLARAGVPESLIPRTLQALRLLDLIDEDGQPELALEDLARASSEDYKKRMEEVVRSAYADVFQYTDPATDDAERVRDAFRSYSPRGQQDRMVTLFLGLCEFAGIIDAAPKRTTPPNVIATRPGRPSTSAKSRSGGRSRATSKVGPPDLGESQRHDRTPPLLAALLRELPETGTPLTGEQRQRFIDLFGTLLDFHYGTVAGLEVEAELHSAGTLEADVRPEESGATTPEK